MQRSTSTLYCLQHALIYSFLGFIPDSISHFHLLIPLEKSDSTTSRKGTFVPLSRGEVRQIRWRALENPQFE